ncbi:Uncharacterised protein [Staphylococcus aureus]|nr:Uncharacterised protein [Staphylococcus aureus]
MTTIRHLYYKREEEAFFYTKNFENVVDVHYKNEYTNICVQQRTCLLRYLSNYLRDNI